MDSDSSGSEGVVVPTRRSVPGGRGRGIVKSRTDDRSRNNGGAVSGWRQRSRALADGSTDIDDSSSLELEPAHQAGTSSTSSSSSSSSSYSPPRVTSSPRSASSPRTAAASRAQPHELRPDLATAFARAEAQVRTGLEAEGAEAKRPLLVEAMTALTALRNKEAAQKAQREAEAEAAKQRKRKAEEDAAAAAAAAAPPADLRVAPAASEDGASLSLRLSERTLDDVKVSPRASPREAVVSDTGLQAVLSESEPDDLPPALAALPPPAAAAGAAMGGAEGLQAQVQVQAAPATPVSSTIVLSPRSNPPQSPPASPSAAAAADTGAATVAATAAPTAAATTIATPAPTTAAAAAAASPADDTKTAEDKQDTLTAPQSEEAGEEGGLRLPCVVFLHAETKALTYLHNVVLPPAVHDVSDFLEHCVKLPQCAKGVGAEVKLSEVVALEVTKGEELGPQAPVVLSNRLNLSQYLDALGHSNGEGLRRKSILVRRKPAEGIRSPTLPNLSLVSTPARDSAFGDAASPGVSPVAGSHASGDDALLIGATVEAENVTRTPALNGKKGIVNSITDTEVTVEFASPWHRRVLNIEEVRVIGRPVLMLEAPAQRRKRHSESAVPAGVVAELEFDVSGMTALGAAQRTQTPQPPGRRSEGLGKRRSATPKGSARRSSSLQHKQDFDSSFQKEPRWKPTVIKPLPRGTVIGRGRTTEEETHCPDCNQPMDVLKFCMVTKNPHTVTEPKSARRLTIEEQEVASHRLARDGSPQRTRNGVSAWPAHESPKTTPHAAQRRRRSSSSPGFFAPPQLSTETRARRRESERERAIARRTPSPSPASALRRSPSAGAVGSRSSNHREGAESELLHLPHAVAVAGAEVSVSKVALNGLYTLCAPHGGGGSRRRKKQRSVERRRSRRSPSSGAANDTAAQVRVYQHESSPAIVFWRDSRWRLNDVGATDGWLYSNESLLGQWAEDAEAADFSGVYGTPYPCVTVAEDPKQAHADKFALLRVLFQALKRELPRERDPSCQRVLEMLRQDSVQHAFWIKSDGGIPVNWGALLEERLRLLEEQAINAMEYGTMGGAGSGCDDEGENSAVRDCDAVSWVTFERFCWESITAVATRSKSEEAAEAAEAAAAETAAAQPKARSVSVVAPAEHALRDTLVCAGHPSAAPPSTPPSARVLQYGDDEVCTPQALGDIAEGDAADAVTATATTSPAAAGPAPSAEGTPPQLRSSNSKERRHSAEPGVQRSNSVDTAATMPATSPSPQATPAAATPGSNATAAVEPSPSRPEPSPQEAQSEPRSVPSPPQQPQQPQPQPQPQQPVAVPPPPPTEAEAELEAMRREMCVMKASLALTAEFETETDQAVSEHAAGLYKLEAAFLRQRAELVEAERRVAAAAEAEQREAERKDLERRLAEVEAQAREKLDREEKRTEKLQQLLTQRAVRTPSAGSPTVPPLRLDASGSSFPSAASPPLPEAARLRDSTAARPAETPAPPAAAAAPAAPTPPTAAAPPDLREQIRDKKKNKKDKGEDDSGCCVVC
eukprot:Rhum_TRINITY_DN10263_c0_g1::Rhum_TRINITY_DN10263_c0_g1_i1::g.37639::m.37639